jgi:hypothetical protein
MNPPQDRSSLALEKLVRRYESRVRAVGHRYSLAGADIDELFQEIRIRLWKALESPDRIETVSAPYVHRAATTAAVDLIRRKRAGGGGVTSIQAGRALSLSVQPRGRFYVFLHKSGGPPKERSKRVPSHTGHSRVVYYLMCKMP